MSRLATLLRALVYLQAMTVYNAVRQRLKRLRQPRYLIGALVGVGYFSLLFFSHGGSRPGGGDLGKLWTPDPALHALVVDLIGAGLLLIALFAWLLPSGRAALRFTETEIAFLFPAPLTRRTLIQYKLLRSQLGILFTALVMSFVTRRGSGVDAHPLLHVLGWWLMFSTLRLHFLAASFGRDWLLDLGVRPWLRRTVAAIATIALFGGSFWWISRNIAPPAIADFSELPRLRAYVTGVLDTPPLSWALLPFAWMAAPAFATDPAMFLRALPAALAMLILHYLWVLRFDTAFEEASMDAARRRAEYVAAWRSGRRQSWRQGTQKARKAPFALAPTGLPSLAFLWKGLIALGPMLHPRNWLIACAAAVLGLGWLTGQPQLRALTISIGVGALAFAGWLLIVGPLFTQSTLRRTFEHFDVLKVMPLRGRQIVLGELMTPIATLVGVQWLLLLTGTLALWPLTQEGRFAPDVLIVGAIAAAVLSPALLGLMLCVPFAGMLLFPAWLVGPAAQNRGGGIEVLGQRLIFFAGYLLVLVLAVLPATALASVAFLAAQWLGGGIAAGIVAAAPVALAVLTVEWWLVVAWLGRRVDRMDLSLEQLA